jgi:hypothetical protein
MKNLNFATLSETRHDEQDLSRMNDEGCPNDPVLSVLTKAGIEGTYETVGQIRDRPRPESLGLGADVPQPLLDLIDVVRCRLSMEIEENSRSANEGDLISSIVT